MYKENLARSKKTTEKLNFSPPFWPNASATDHFLLADSLDSCNDKKNLCKIYSNGWNVTYLVTFVDESSPDFTVVQVPVLTSIETARSTRPTVSSRHCTFKTCPANNIVKSMFNYCEISKNVLIMWKIAFDIYKRNQRENVRFEKILPAVIRLDASTWSERGVGGRAAEWSWW